MAGKVPHARCKEIEKEILFMYEECEIHTFPIDCFEICRKLHYVVRTYSSLPPDEQFDAYFLSEDSFSRVEVNPLTGMNEYVIYYNESIGNSGRIRWSIFHEIAHIYLGHHDHPDDSLYDEEEAEANMFARYASAPCPLVNEANCETDTDVAEKFDLSYTASHWAFVSWQNWLRFGSKSYEDFELQMLKLFNMAVA